MKLCNDCMPFTAAFYTCINPRCDNSGSEEVNNSDTQAVRYSYNSVIGEFGPQLYKGAIGVFNTLDKLNAWMNGGDISNPKKHYMLIVKGGKFYPEEAWGSFDGVVRGGMIERLT